MQEKVGCLAKFKFIFSKTEMLRVITVYDFKLGHNEAEMSRNLGSMLAVYSLNAP